MQKSYQTACGNLIIQNDLTTEHLRAHPEADGLLEMAIRRIILPDDFFLKMEVVFDNVIGQSSCVAVNKNAPQMFAVRVGRTMPTRVVPGAQKVDSKSFMVVAKKDKRTGVWNLITGYTGATAPPEPHDRSFVGYRRKNKFDFLVALAFWSSHGLVWEREVMGDPYESSWKAELIKMNHPCARFAW